MNARTAYTLIAILATIGTLSTSQAFAQVGLEDIREQAMKSAAAGIPITITTDSDTYNHESTIYVTGQVANVKPEGVPVTLTVTSPLNNIVTIQQLSVSQDGLFATQLNTAGALWKYDGIYVIRVQYGAQEVNNRVLVELNEGVDIVPPTQIPTEPKPTLPEACGPTELTVADSCAPYTIVGGMVTGTLVNLDDKSLVITIDSEEDGVLTLNPLPQVMEGYNFILVDGQEWNDYEVDGQMLTIMFPAGTEEIEVIVEFIVPEFGSIAVLILVIAISAIIAISARSRINMTAITPKF